MKFNENIPNYKFKAALLNQEITMTRKIKFYQCFENREHSNSRFISKCRFYWSDESPEVLCQVYTSHVF